MTKTNAANERIKRQYLQYLVEAKGQNGATIDRVAAPLARFEASTCGRDFERFHREQAVAFKAKLAAALNARTGERLSKLTVLATVRDLRAFFFWLAHLPSIKSATAYADAGYFNLSDKEVAVARARREALVPTLERARHVLTAIPSAIALGRRDRALVAFAVLTGAHIGALASSQLGHVDVAGGFAEQDPRAVRTKAAMSFRTYFMPVDGTRWTSSPPG